MNPHLFAPIGGRHAFYADCAENCPKMTTLRTSTRYDCGRSSVPDRVELFHDNSYRRHTGFDKGRSISIIAHLMTASVRVEAPAKINLHLRVYGRRPDGFHGILSLFQAVSLSDVIVVRSLKKPDTVVIDGDFDCPPERTTVYKAVMAFRQATGIRGGLSITVDKKVPAGAGLGGGSGDAAAVLRALDAIFGTGMDLDGFSKAGVSIGSDVPFFFTGGAALVSGRGECVEPISARDDFHLVIVYPGFPVSTVQAYSLLDEARPDDSGEQNPDRFELEAGYRNDPVRWPFRNSFEAHVGAANPAIPEIRNWLVGSGASFAAMTGSGSAIFGVFGTADRALAACKALAGKGVYARFAHPLARLPALD
jgi:4-diphosphocytidyl-2-C-methyl-D-erythritol kinase